MKESSSHCFYEKKIREIELFYYYYYSFHEYFPEWKFMVFKLTSQPPQYSQFVVTSVGQMAGLRFKIPPWSDPIVLPTIQILEIKKWKVKFFETLIENIEKKFFLMYLPFEFVGNTYNCLHWLVCKYFFHLETDLLFHKLLIVLLDKNYPHQLYQFWMKYNIGLRKKSLFPYSKKMAFKVCNWVTTY